MFDKRNQWFIRRKELGINQRLHICITSVNFDAKPEGICTGRLIRALLNNGIRITLITSNKSILGYEHPSLQTIALPYRPRSPRIFFKFWAKLSGSIDNNFFLWTRRAVEQQFSSNDIPNLFYGRAWPYASLVPAFFFSKRYNVPFIAHLSDPFPPPNETYKGSKSLKNLNAMLVHASVITFTNEETIAYQGRYTPIVADKAHVLPHVRPKAHKLPPANNDLQRYYHIGAIGNRKPVMYAALKGFKHHLSRYPNAKLKFVGPKPGEVRPFIQQLSIEKHVTILPYAPDIKTVMAPATALISYEPHVETPIWTLTKTIEYLSANRCVFALTSKNSPTERLLRQFPESCIVVNDYDYRAIAEGYDRLAELTPSDDHFVWRLEKLSDYEGGSVARKFNNICTSILKKFPNHTA